MVRSVDSAYGVIVLVLGIIFVMMIPAPVSGASFTWCAGSGEWADPSHWDVDDLGCGSTPLLPSG